MFHIYKNATNFLSVFLQQSKVETMGVFSFDSASPCSQGQTIQSSVDMGTFLFPQPAYLLSHLHHSLVKSLQ